MILTVCAMIFSSLLSAEGGRPRDSQKVGLGVSPEAERLLLVLEDKAKPSAERVAAIERLSERREAATVPRMLRLLPGQSDVVTLRVVIVLGQMGDRAALPKLKMMRDHPNQRYVGKINVALDSAIEQLDKRSHQP
jgi:hypothetical protein